MRHLALKSLKGRKAYSAIIITAVAAAVVMTLFSLFVADSARLKLDDSRLRLGPDLAVVPKGSKARGHTYLSKGPPAEGAVPAGTLEQLGIFSEIEVATLQKRLGAAAVGTVQATLIAFDPSTDFVVQPWLDKHSTESFLGRDKGLVLGVRVSAEGFTAALPTANGKSVGGSLLATGTFMDTAIFIPKPSTEIAAEPSWILLKLRQGVSPDITADRLEVNIARIEVRRRPEMFKTISNQLYVLVEGGAFGAATLLTIVGVLLVIGAMFTLMAHERKREFGLLKALGASNAFVFKLVMGEAALLGSVGAALGAGIVSMCLLCVHTGIVPHEIPLALPSSAVVLWNILAAMALTVVVAVLAALYPALAATRLEPYAAIRNGE